MPSRFLIIALLLFLGNMTAAALAADAKNSFGGQIISGVDGCCVGIGTLKPQATVDVYRGELKFGSSGVACTNVNPGSLRYADKHLQLCDGTSWRNVSLDKAE